MESNQQLCVDFHTTDRNLRRPGFFLNRGLKMTNFGGSSGYFVVFKIAMFDCLNISTEHIEKRNDVNKKSYSVSLTVTNIWHCIWLAMYDSNMVIAVSVF